MADDEPCLLVRSEFVMAVTMRSATFYVSEGRAISIFRMKRCVKSCRAHQASSLLDLIFIPEDGISIVPPHRYILYFGRVSVD
jgi:hypothetical protein